MSDRPTARAVIVTALTKRHEELRDEAMPNDYDGASQILNALQDEGYSIVRLDDISIVKANARQTTARSIRDEAVDEAVDGQLPLTAVMRICEEAGR